MVIEGGGDIVKTALLVSVIVMFAEFVILIRQLAEGEFGTVQEYEPDAALKFETIVIQFTPLFIEYSIFMLATRLLVHVILFDVPLVHVSPPLGEVTVTEGGVVIVKTELLTSFNWLFDVSEILIKQFGEGILGTAQE